MGRRGKKHRGLRCRVCGIQADTTAGETFCGGRCESCRWEAAKQRRRSMEQKLLDQAKPVRVEVRDGREYVVVKLPPKRRGGWK
jgi:hypothetical protein